MPTDSSQEATFATTFPGEQLVIPLSAARRTRLAFAGASVAVSLGSAIWIVVSPSWASIIYGGFTIAAFGWVWGTRLAARRARGNAPVQIVATSQGLSSPFWSLDWNRVNRIWISPTASGKLQALNIEPIQPGDVTWTRSKTLRFNARIGHAMNMPPLQIFQANVDRPLEELASDFQRLARRKLG